MRQSNLYIVIYSAILTVVCGGLLAFASQTLKPRQDANIELERKQNILATVVDLKVGDNIDQIYAQRVKEMVIDFQGNVKEAEFADRRGDLAGHRLQPLGVGGVASDIGRVQANQIQSRFAVAVLHIDHVVPAGAAASVERPRGVVQHLVRGSVIVEQIVIAPREKPRHPKLRDFRHGDVHVFRAAPFRIVVPEIAGESQQMRLRFLDKPGHHLDRRLVKPVAFRFAVAEEVNVGQLQDAQRAELASLDAAPPRHRILRRSESDGQGVVRPRPAGCEARHAGERRRGRMLEDGSAGKSHEED